jgi:hypothetical protein
VAPEKTRGRLQRHGESAANITKLQSFLPRVHSHRENNRAAFGNDQRLPFLQKEAKTLLVPRARHPFSKGEFRAALTRSAVFQLLHALTETRSSPNQLLYIFFIPNSKDYARPA